MSAQPKETLEKVLQHLGFPATVEEHHLDDGLLLDVKTEDPGRLIGRQGQTLSDLQYIVNRMLFQQDENAPKVTVDVGGYRSQAREALVKKAQDAAEKVRRWGDVVELEPMNAFDRRMCEEMRAAWKRVKDDPAVNAVVLRAAGDRAFCAGLDTKQSYGQPDDVWNHEDPGELLSPKWQKVWKPVVCAVHGICTAGAFYFVNESDIVICSPDATFFDSHVSAGLVSALEPVGLMRRIGLGETLRMALLGNDERVGAETALRIGLVTEIVPREALWERAHALAAEIAARPSAATQGTVRAIWESLDRPYRAALEQGLIYTRLGNPIGMAEVAKQPPERRKPRIR